jgi:hypothetical protein
MSFLRQLFGITTRRSTEEQKLHRSNRKTLVAAMNYEKEEGETKDDFFEYIIGYNDIKKISQNVNKHRRTHTLTLQSLRNTKINTKQVQKAGGRLGPEVPTVAGQQQLMLRYHIIYSVTKDSIAVKWILMV